MSIQINSNVTLQVVLAATPATNQLPCSASYVDQGGNGGDNTINTNGTTAVTLVGSPAASVERLVSNVSIPNADTASATVTVNKVVSGTPSRLVKVTLQPGYALYYDSNWRVMDPNGNFLCDVTVSSGSITSNQGAPAALANAWPVEVTDGTNVLGTSSHPLRIDPTGTTQQPINIVDLAGSALGGPTAWGVAPASGTEVINVNANIVAGGSGGGGNVNVTEWNTVALGSPSNYGTSPGAVAVIGVNAFVTNNLTVNTHAVTQSGAWTVSLSAGSAAIGTVGVTSLPALPAGSNTIGAVNQGTNPWIVSGTVSQGGLIAGIGSQPASTTTPQSLGLGGSARTLRSLYVFLNNPVLAAGSVAFTLKDGAGNTLLVGSLPASTIATATFLGPILDVDNLNIPAANASGPFTVTLSANLTSGSYIFTIGAT
jgi:hypothetical protein